MEPFNQLVATFITGNLWIQKEEDLFVFTVTVAIVLSGHDIRMP